MIEMSNNAFAEGEQAAAKDIPREANPYEAGTEDHIKWSAGHERIASAQEASQSEGT
jgi:hypothetical protein